MCLNFRLTLGTKCGGDPLVWFYLVNQKLKFVFYKPAIIDRVNSFESGHLGKGREKIHLSITYLHSLFLLQNYELLETQPFYDFIQGASPNCFPIGQF